MNDEVYKNLILDSLLVKDPNKNLFYEKMAPNLLTNDPNYIFTAPINPLYMENIDASHSIVLTKEVYETLEIIEDYNFKNKKEVPFILFGKETKGGAIIFDDIDCDFKKLEDASASFDNIEEYFSLKLNRVAIDREKNKVFCLGHTHPFNGNRLVFNYSLQDFVVHLHFAHMDIFYDKNNNNKIFSLMKSISKDFNFVYYDVHKNRFYKVPKVFLQEKKREYTPLSAYNFCDN